MNAIPSSLETAAPRNRAFGERIEVSFEFFPPATEATEAQLWRAVDRLAPLAPRFLSVTYGAGGTTRDRTLAAVSRIQPRCGAPAAGHLTCVGASRAEVDAVARAYRDAGVTRIVALRGDSPDLARGFEPHPDGYANAAALVAGLRRIHDFDIYVAAYPECHPDSDCEASDLDNLKRKLDAGANCALTQFFFDNDDFYRFVERARAAGIDAPIIPGMMPVSNFRQAARFAGRCGAKVPSWMAEQFEGLDDEPETRKLVAAAIAADQCRALMAQGVRKFHFYTLNRPELTRAVCHMLGVRAQACDDDAIAASESASPSASPSASASAPPPAPASATALAAASL